MGAPRNSRTLEVVRKGSRYTNQTFPSGSGEPPAEGAVAFPTWQEVVRKGALLQASPPDNGNRSVRSFSEAKSKSGSIPCPVWLQALMAHSNSAAELCQLRKGETQFLMSESHHASIGYELHGSPGLGKGALLQASPPDNGNRSFSSFSESKSKSKSKSKSGSGSGSIPALYGTRPSWPTQTPLPSCVSTAKAEPCFSCLNPITRPSGMNCMGRLD